MNEEDKELFEQRDETLFLSEPEVPSDNVFVDHEEISEPQQIVLSENETTIQKSSSVYKGRDYQTVVSELEDFGFSNIQTVAIYDLSTDFFDSFSHHKVEIFQLRIIANLGLMIFWIKIQRLL